MSLFNEFRSRAKYVVGPVMGVCAVVYFAFHAFHGDRGVFTWIQLKQQVTTARALYNGVLMDRYELENRVSLLNPNSLDPDMLEERARLLLNYGYADEVVVFERANPNTDTLETPASNN